MAGNLSDLLERAGHPGYARDAKVMEDAVSRLIGNVEDLSKAFFRYAKHDNDCISISFGLQRCDCGYREALEKVPCDCGPGSAQTGYRYTCPRCAALETNGLGPWEVNGPSRAYSNRAFWTIRRWNPEFNKGFCQGWETLATKTHKDRKFYSEDAAVKEAAKRNAISR